jgi:hypothetical protein
MARIEGRSLFVTQQNGGMMKKLFVVLLLAGLFGCTQEAQNQLGRSIQNWTGTNGVLEVYSGDTLVRRFVKIDKLSTAYGTSDSQARGYRFGYGISDINLDGLPSAGEKKVYFEVSEFSTYVFYEQP